MTNLPVGRAVPSEMISGPDLGGGFLFQLSADRDGERRWFTFHAQDGGDDAGGPPVGSPAPLGFLPTPEACQYGGPRCWHRPFVLPLDQALRVRVAYNRLRFVMATMLGQVYNAAPVPVEATMTEIIDRVAPELREAQIPWAIEGPAARWITGGPPIPGSIEMQTSEAGVDRLSAIWSDYLIEPTAWTELPERWTVYGAAAFLGSVKSGTRVRFYALPARNGPGGSGSVRFTDQVRSKPWKGIQVPLIEP